MLAVGEMMFDQTSSPGVIPSVHYFYVYYDICIFMRVFVIINVHICIGNIFIYIFVYISCKCRNIYIYIYTILQNEIKSSAKVQILI